MDPGRYEFPHEGESWNKYAARLNTVLSEGYVLQGAFPIDPSATTVNPLGFGYVFVKRTTG